MYSLPYYALFPGLGVGRVCAVCCLCVIRALASVGVCGWGQGIATPHTAVLSPRSTLSIFSAELLLLALNVSFWGRGREFSQIPTVQPSARHVSFKTRPSLGLLRRGGVSLWARPWLVIGQWAGGGGPGGGEGLPSCFVPSAPPPSLGLRVKFQPPHVTRHGRCLRPAPLSRGPPDGSSPGTPYP